jgi:hypothetical protein
MQKPIRDWKTVTAILFLLNSGLCEAPVTSEKWRSHSDTGKESACILDYMKLQRRQRNEEAIQRLEKNHIYPIM